MGERVSSGEVILDGAHIANLSESDLVDVRRRKIAYVFQQYHLIPSLTALENVLLPLTFCGSGNEDEKRGVESGEKNDGGIVGDDIDQKVAGNRIQKKNPEMIVIPE